MTRGGCAFASFGKIVIRGNDHATVHLRTINLFLELVEKKSNYANHCLENKKGYYLSDMGECSCYSSSPDD
jgi:hypothetical protein